MDRYNVPIDPFNRIWVPPDAIAYKSKRERRKWANFATDIGSVKAGDWDQSVDEFSSLYPSLKAHFEDGVPWENTQLYARAKKAISNGEYVLRMSVTEEELRQRLDELDHLYETIRREGYKSQEELGEYTTELDQLANEIQVDIGRDGTLLFLEGRHRLSIAKVLGIDAVPVVVVCRHREWIERLEESFGRGELVSHPDWNNVNPSRSLRDAATEMY